MSLQKGEVSTVCSHPSLFQAHGEGTMENLPRIYISVSL